MKKTPDFEAEWPELARRLERFLAAKGVDAWLRGDVVQETATRLYRKWPKLDRSLPLWNLVVTIALGVLVDERRKVSRVELVPDVPEYEIDDVETRALHRVHLTRTRSALKQLRPNQRRVLLAEIGEAAALDGSRNRNNVLRLRARLALRGALGPWALTGVALRVRSLRAAIDRRLTQWGHDAHGATASMASVAVSATLLLSGAGIDNFLPKLPGSLPQHPQVISPDDGGERRGFGPVAGSLPRLGPFRPVSGVTDWAERQRAATRRDPKEPVDPVEFQKKWVQNQREWAQEQVKKNEERHREWAEERRKWAEETKEENEERQRKWIEEQRKWAEENLR